MKCYAKEDKFKTCKECGEFISVKDDLCMTCHYQKYVIDADNMDDNE